MEFHVSELKVTMRTIIPRILKFNIGVNTFYARSAR
jgi:hypothetical protein